MTFSVPPFWAQGIRPATAVHAVSVVVTPPTVEPLTLAQAKLWAGVDWVVGDARDVLLLGFIAAARSKVEQDTGLALLTQTRDVYFDALPSAILDLPARPLQSVTSLKVRDSSGVETTIAADQYIVDLAGSRIGLALGAAWPTDVRSLQPFVLRVIVGYLDVAALTAAAPLLVHAVGLLTSHYATVGRDLTTVGTIITTTPQGYDDVIAAYRPVHLI